MRALLMRRVAAAPSSTYRYWRIYVTAVDGSTGYVSAGEYELFASSDTSGTDLTASATVSQSGDGSVGAAAAARDDLPATESGSTLALPYWWKADLGTAQVVGSLSIQAQRIVPDRTPSTFKLQGSNDDSNWFDVLSPATQTGWGEIERRIFPRTVPAGAYRYFRLRFLRWVFAGGSPGTSGDVRASEFQLFEAGSSGDIQFPLSRMSSNTAPAPLVASASSSNGSFPAWGAFTRATSDSSRWISGSGGGVQWLQIDLGAGNGCLPTSFKLAPDGAVGSGYYPFEIELLASNTGAFSGEETQLYYANNLSSGWANNTLRTFTL